MCKPQFEAGKELINKGVIKNEAMRRKILSDFETWLKTVTVVLDKADSDTAGEKGNVERFFLVKKNNYRHPVWYNTEMEESTHIADADVSTFSIERLQKELQGVQMSLEMLFTKNNSLDDADLVDGGGSPEDQAEFQRLNKAQRTIVSEINKRHMLNELH